MKKFTLIITIAAIFSGCRPSVTETPNANTNVSPNAGTPANTSSNLVPYNTAVDSNAFNGNSANTVVINKQPANQKSDYGPRTAPDDSEFNTTMNAKGEVLETRTFKSHQQLLKIERKTVGQEQTLKVYLKNGKTYDLSEEKVPNFRVAAPQNILTAIGVASKPEPKPETKDKSKEEAENKN